MGANRTRRCNGGLVLVTYQGNICMKRPMMDKPMTKASLWAHHIWILFRAHPLAILCRELRSIAPLVSFASRGSSAVGWRPIFVGLWHHRRFVFYFFGKRFGTWWDSGFRGCMAEGGDGEERVGSAAGASGAEEKRAAWEEEAGY